MDGRGFPENNFNRNEGYRNDQDLRVAYGGKFINPSPAGASDAHELHAKTSKVPVSFATEAGRFRLSGIQGGTSDGVIVSGVITGDAVKINHILVSEALRHTGISGALLAELENQLKLQHVKIAYATFGKLGTVDFFLKNGYVIIPFDSLEEEIKKSLDMRAEGIETDVRNDDDYAKLGLKIKEDPEYDSRQILLAKKLG